VVVNPWVEPQRWDIEAARVDAVISRKGQITREHIEKGGGRMKIIARTGVGVDPSRVDLEAAKELKVWVTNQPGSNAVSVESAQRANATFKTAQALSARAQAELLAAQRQLNVIETQKQQARAALMQARAERDLAQLNVGYTELKAPVDGVIGNRRARVGAGVSPAGLRTPGKRWRRWERRLTSLRAAR